MKEFINPEIEILELEFEDIMESSNPGGWFPENPEGGMGWG
jgi:hypothetical protein